MQHDTKIKYKEQFQAFFTSIDAEPANHNTLHAAARIRLLFIFPCLFLFTLLSLVILKGNGYDPQAELSVFMIWITLALLYLLINSFLAYAPNTKTIEPLLNYLSIFIELATNEAVLYLGGSLTSHATLFIIVAVAVYRVFLGHRYALFAAVTGVVLFGTVAFLEVSKLVPLSPGLSQPVVHSVYSLSGGWVESVIAVIIGIFITFISINYGMNQALKYRRKLELQAILDGLTCIPNRRYFDEHLAKEWKRAFRYARPISLIMIDIDNFKAYNDHYGHLSGDECLRRVALLLQKGVRRPTDIVARFGGEEFAVLLPDTTLIGAKVLAELLRTEIEAASIEHAYSNVSPFVTISLGVASVVPDSLFPELLIDYADRAMYYAKQNGRNRVESFMPPPPEMDLPVFKSAQ